MDGLALLCNLHADGPLTLRRLRGAGIQGLGQLDRIPLDVLAGVLRATPGQTRRFVQEARLLAQRVYEPVEEALSAAEEAVVGFDASHAAETPSATPVDPHAAAPNAVASRGAAMSARSAPRRSQPIFDPTQAARPVTPQPAAPSQAQPASTPAAAATPSPVQRPVVHVAHAPEPDNASRPAPYAPNEKGTHGISNPTQPFPAAARTVAPAPTTSTGVALTPERLPSLDSDVAARLASEGISSLEALVEQTSLGLAKRLRVPFTRLLDLQYHARRTLVEERRGKGATVSERTVSPFPPIHEPTPSRTAPVSRPEAGASGAVSPGPAGPFA